MSGPLADDILKSVVSRSLLLTIGNSAVAIIKARTLRGEFLPGSDANASQYSSKPAPMPYGGLVARLGKGKAAEVLKRIDRKDEPGSVYKLSKAGKMWIVLQGGYKRLRELAGRESDRTTMNWSGNLMRALNVIDVNEAEYSVTVGFTDSRAAELAGWHESGAGKNKKKRIFVGLSGEEVNRIAGAVQFTK